MNIKEYYEYLKANKLSASFKIERIVEPDSVWGASVDYDFDTPHVKLVRENIRDYLNGDGATSSKQTYLITEEGKVFEDYLSYFIDSENMNESYFTNLSTALSLLPEVLLQKYFGVNELDDISELDEALIEDASFTYEASDDSVESISVDINGDDIIDEEYLNKLKEWILDSIKALKHINVNVCLSFWGSDIPGDSYMSGSKLENKCTHKEVDIENTSLTRMGLEFELINQ